MAGNLTEIFSDNSVRYPQNFEADNFRKPDINRAIIKDIEKSEA
jgi:hypothetical protein